MTIKDYLKVANQIADTVAKELHLKVDYTIMIDDEMPVASVYLAPKEAEGYCGLKDCGVIYLSTKKNDNVFDLTVNIAHELRHAYQHEHPEEFDFSNYIRNGEGYATQPVEVDAIAYSELFLQTIDNKVHLNLPEEVRILVDERKKIIAK